ncbi:MAG: type II secretion system F family protein [Candidatus Buchananbacteria bacterium]|nr:type II secretion system F family protein [Candidatus Buchananbacteria bacterium]
MSLFSYKAKNEKNQLIEGVVDAISEDVVVILLLEKGLSVLEIKKQNYKYFENKILGFLNKVKVKEKVIFFRQLSVMVDANLPIVKALGILVKQSDNKYFKSIIAGIADEVDGGAKLSQAMATYPHVFSDFYTNIIASGESSGRLSEVMIYLADQQGKDYDLQSKVRGAMIYPAIILAGLFIVGLIIMIFVVPQMTQVLKDSGARLPLVTRILIGLADFLKYYWFLVVILVVAIVNGFFFFTRRTIKGRRIFDLFKIKVPGFGTIAVNIYVVRMTRSLNTLLKGGVPVSRALKVVKRVVGNVIYEEMIDQTIKDVDEGGSLSESILANKYMPALVSQMINVGEETGKLEDILDKITEFYSREIDNSVANLSVLIEPLIMIILGIVVGGFVAAVILPMWQLSAVF